MSSILVASGQLTASAIVMAPIALLVDRSWVLAAPGARVIWTLVALAQVSTAAGYIVYFEVLARAGATNVLLVTLLIPPSATLLGALFLAERIEGRDLVGLAFIAGGLAAIDGRISNRLWKRTRSPAAAAG